MLILLFWLLWMAICHLFLSTFAACNGQRRRSTVWRACHVRVCVCGVSDGWWKAPFPSCWLGTFEYLVWLLRFACCTQRSLSLSLGTCWLYHWVPVGWRMHGVFFNRGVITEFNCGVIMECRYLKKGVNLSWSGYNCLIEDNAYYNGLKWWRFGAIIWTFTLPFKVTSVSSLCQLQERSWAE